VRNPPPSNVKPMPAIITPSAEVESYIARQPAPTQQALRTLRACIWLAAPHLTELMNYQIPAFALVEGGRRDQQVMLAGYTRHVGFYPHPETIAAFVPRLAEYKFAKGSVQFALNKPMPEALVVEMVRYRLEQLTHGAR